MTDLLDKNGGGAGICTYSAAVSKVTESCAFLVNLLIGTTFDVFIDSSGLSPRAPKSAGFVEAFWRPRERVPAAHSEATVPVGGGSGIR